ncbi:carbohydrate ABC transporter permease [Microlunatus sp. GCM10028923]|uniref:carbohydrate ABC transporter permease n=1 Tax=Microlunatus sp. GCM10028923 TaxID=3273400 RepID=UPI003609A6D3
MSSTERPIRRRRQRWRGAAAVYLILTAGAAVTLGPFLLSLFTSLKTPRQFASASALTAPLPPTVDNYLALFGTEHDLARPIFVTLLVAGFTVITQLTFSVLAGYAFARLRFPGREQLFWVYLATMMVPGAVTIVPLYLIMVEAGLRDTFWGLALPGFLGSPYAIFLLRQYFRGISSELVDAARLDGASRIDVLVEIILPLSRPIIATLTLITVVTEWNSFLWPLVITSGDTWRVLTVATATLQSQYNGNWTVVMAATTIAVVPLLVLFVVFQRQIVRAIAIGPIR